MNGRKLPRELSDVRAIVTGSTRGLGEGIARHLAAAGASVVVNGTSADRCGQIAGDIGGVAVSGSVGDESVVQALFAAAHSEFGGVDVVINNAGNSRDGLIAKAEVDDFDAVINVHLRGTWLMCREAARAMRQTGGAIVNVVSGTALYGNVGQSAYASAKGGVLGLTRALALELRWSGIRVNAVAPVVRTDMVEPLLGVDPALARYFGAPDHVAPVFGFLASGAAKHISGEVLGFDGRGLAIWTHPSMIQSLAHGGQWAHDDFARVLTGHFAQTPNPDEFGRAVHRALGVA